MDARISSPIIIFGMHRSGTSMIAQMLSELGLFVGSDCDEHDESRFFFRTNEWLLSQGGATWDNPEQIKHLLQNDALRARILDYLCHYLRSPRTTAYLGMLKYLRYRSLFNVRCPWGWKDPRNTFTLPIWLDLFPSAKIIHVYRHGIDVARSLQTREEEYLERKNRYSLLIDRIYTVLPRRAKFVRSAKCFNLEEAFNLWETYMIEARKQICSVSGSNIEIKYESFLSTPVPYLKKLVEFCGLKASNMLVEKVAGRVSQDRAYSFRSSSELREFGEKVRSRLENYAY